MTSTPPLPVLPHHRFLDAPDGEGTCSRCRRGGELYRWRLDLRDRRRVREVCRRCFDDFCSLYADTPLAAVNGAG